LEQGVTGCERPDSSGTAPNGGGPGPRRVLGLPASVWSNVWSNAMTGSSASPGEPEQARLRRAHEHIFTTGDAGGAKIVSICDVGPVAAGAVPELGLLDDQPEHVARARAPSRTDRRDSPLAAALRRRTCASRPASRRDSSAWSNGLTRRRFEAGVFSGSCFLAHPAHPLPVPLRSVSCERTPYTGAGKNRISNRSSESGPWGAAGVRNPAAATEPRACVLLAGA
jgi:hypothetical protein